MLKTVQIHRAQVSLKFMLIEKMVVLKSQSIMCAPFDETKHHATSRVTESWSIRRPVKLVSYPKINAKHISESTDHQN